MKSVLTLALSLALASLAGCNPPRAGDCDAGECSCTSNSECPASHPRCDASKGRCVPCLPQMDNCPAGFRCVAAADSYQCSMTCKLDSQCAGGGRVQPACCDTVCVDVGADPFNCGACGKACIPPPHASPICDTGQCAVGACNEGFADCNATLDDGCEVETSRDLMNCGACGTVCPSGSHGTPSCAAGKCGLSCEGGYGNCNDKAGDGCEVALLSDVKHCGACKMPCPQPASATISCSSGQCSLDQCNAGLANCDGKIDNGCEADTRSDTAHCGGCGRLCLVDHATPACTEGACAIGSCDKGWSDCNGKAADGCESATAGDLANCGGCGKKCEVQNGTPACLDGACVILSCRPGFGDCDGRTDTGCELNLGEDVHNCGACGSSCLGFANATMACVAGRCTLVKCFPGYGDCNRDLRDGCEASFNEPASCGGCAVVCATPAHAAPACGGGMCGLGACTPPWGNCDNKAANGCETSLATDPSHCGGCGRLCFVPNGTPGCAAGVCTVAACAPLYRDCNKSQPDGCEVPVAADTKNCGDCNIVCATPANAQTTCFNGVCGGTCFFGFADCDKNLGNGCEIGILTNVAHCGACGVVCAPVANGTPGCAAGRCGVGKCNANFADCDGQSGNGCEVPTLSDPKNCGGCGRLCVAANGTSNCTNGVCGVASCLPGYRDCNGVAGDGCEIVVDSDPANCGVCGKVCPTPPNAAASCSGGGCSASCNFSFANCNGNLADGCEINIGTDVNNCSLCGNVCPPVANGTPGCKSGACAVATCSPLWGDCDVSPGNGCERTLAADISNCGACGKVCAFANAVASCIGGMCGIGQCNSGWGNCDNNPANGCEVNLTASASHCGACNNACPMNAPHCLLGVCSPPSHATQQLTWDFVASPGCGNASTWYTQNFGAMTWDQCEALANKYGATWAGGPNLNYQAPYAGSSRWAGERDASTAYLTSANWGSLSIVNKASNQNCILGYANSQTHGNLSINQTVVSQTNGITYYVQDFGVLQENVCFSNARDYGARPLNPLSFGVNTTSFMIENHSGHGSCLYSGSNYTTDGNCSQSYRCYLGYYP